MTKDRAVRPRRSFMFVRINCPRDSFGLPDVQAMPATKQVSG